MHYKDGDLYGKKPEDDFAFDPGVLTDEDSSVWLYSGFGSEEIMRMTGNHTSETGCDCIELESDMVTIKTNPCKIIPGRANGKGTPFEGHEFYEASSIRKFDSVYYFIYSSILSHELAYAYSTEGPNKGFVYGGSLHSNGNIGYKGNTKALMYWGNNHGSVERINGKFYIFGHRQTNYHEFSRQGIAEEIHMNENRQFEMAEMTSCGLNGKPLKGKGTYGANIACVLYAKEGACKITEIKDKTKHPCFTQTGEDRMGDPDQYIHNMNDGTVAGFKYFDFDHPSKITLCIQAQSDGIMEVYTDLSKDPIADVAVKASKDRREFLSEMQNTEGTHALYFVWHSQGTADFFSFAME